MSAYTRQGQVNDNTSSFLPLTLSLSTNTLLDPNQSSSNADKFKQDAATHFGTDTTPNCNTALAQTAPVLYNNCVRVRNILGSQLAAIRTISQTLEGRNRKLESMLQSDQYDTAGELQKKQYEISALQAMIANDQMRLQTALAAFQTTRDMYLTKQGEATQARVGGKSDNNDGSILHFGRIVCAGARVCARNDQAVWLCRHGPHVHAGDCHWHGVPDCGSSGKAGAWSPVKAARA